MNTRFSVSSVYSFSLAFAANGSVSSTTEDYNGNWSYTYDDLNRLSAASKTGSSLTFDYDRYGNRFHQSLASGSGTTSSFSFSGSNNQIDGYCYDAVGNLLKEAACPGTISTVPYKYDAENRMITNDSGTHTYLYDAEGRRIAKQNSGTSTEEYLFDLAGRKVATMSSSSVWTLSEVYAGGRHLATYTPSTTYFSHTDWIGTTRARTNPSGTVTLSCSNEPFGSNQSCSGTDASPDHFTGLDNDDVGMTHTWFRQLSPSTGRWNSVDPMAGNIGDPQSLNRYAYVENNPSNFRDPHGLELMWFGNCLWDIGWTQVGTDGDVGPKEYYASFMGCGAGGTSPIPNSIIDDLGGGTSTRNTCQQLAATAGNGPLSSAANSYVEAFKNPVGSLEGYFYGMLMTDEFVYGVGHENREFGPTSIQSQQMAQSLGVAQAISTYLRTGNSRNHYDFGINGLVSAGWNVTEQSVGSFDTTISPGFGVISVTVTNSTSAWSLLYHSTHELDHSRSTFPPLGTTTQTFHLTVPCS